MSTELTAAEQRALARYIEAASELIRLHPKVATNIDKAVLPTNEWLAVIAALAVPNGWKLVPLKPTHRMINAAGETPGMRACNALVTFTQIRNGMPHPDIGSHWSTSPLAQAWAAMVDACPGPHDLVSWQCETPPEGFQAPKLAQDWDETP